MNSLVYAVAAAILLTGGASAQSGEKRVLVYTRQTATAASSYIHDNTASSVAAIRKMGAENGFAVDASEDPGVFTEARFLMGGGQSFLIGLRNLDQFAWLGEFSAGLLAGVEFDLDKELPGIVTPALNQKLRLSWIGCGTEDPRFNGHLDLVANLKARGVTTVFRTTPGGHEWKVWRHQLAEMLPELFRGKR